MALTKYINKSFSKIDLKEDFLYPSSHLPPSIPLEMRNELKRGRLQADFREQFRHTAYETEENQWRGAAKQTNKQIKSHTN